MQARPLRRTAPYVTPRHPSVSASDEHALSDTSQHALSVVGAEPLQSRALFDVTYTYERRITADRRERGEIESVHLRGTLVYFSKSRSARDFFGIFRRISTHVGCMIDVEAQLPDGKSVAHVAFMSEVNDPNALSVPGEGDKLRVHYAFRLHGIGTKLYELAIVSAGRLGLQIVPSTDQTDDGRAMWRRLGKRGRKPLAPYDRRLHAEP